MAIYNEILVGRYAKSLQRLFSIKGGVPAKQVSGEIMAVHPLFSGVENRFVEGWDRFINTVVQPAVAAQNSQIRFRNPLKSNVVAVIEKALVLPASADQPAFQLATTNSDFSQVTTSNNIRMDARSGNRAGSLIASRGSGAAIVGAIAGQLGLAANISGDLILDVDQEYTLLPGDALAVFSNIVNSALTLTVIWRERVVEESETI